MRDRFDRDIDYIRFSITDRCNLRCQYCMPQGLPRAATGHAHLRGVFAGGQAAVELGVTRFKVTGGEPWCAGGAWTSSAG